MTRVRAHARKLITTRAMSNRFRVSVAACSLLLVACQADEALAPSGQLVVTTVTTGPRPDPDGYTVVLDDRDYAVGTSAALSIGELGAGEHRLALAGLAANCRADAANLSVVTIVAGRTADVTLTVECTDIVGSLEVTVATSGLSLDSDGYRLLIDQVDRGPIVTNGDTLLTDVATGSHAVGLDGLASNCHTDAPPRVEVGADSTAHIELSVTCDGTVEDTTQTLVAITSTTGSSLDPNGYVLRIMDHDTVGIGLNDTVRVTGIPPNNYYDDPVGLDLVSEDCGVQSDNPAQFTSRAGHTDTVRFDVLCRTPIVSPWQSLASATTQDIVAISGRSGSDLFAASHGDDPGSPLWGGMNIVHYDGIAWTTQFAHIGTIYDIWAAPGNRAYAVTDGGFPTPVLAFDGKAWSPMPAPKIDFEEAGGALYALWGSSATDVFAVGYIESSSGGEDPYIAHFDGVEWAPMPLPQSASSDLGWLTDVWGTGPNDVYAVGTLHFWDDPFGGMVYHYDGQRWSKLLEEGYKPFRYVWGRSATEVYVTAATPMPRSSDPNDSGWPRSGAGIVMRFDGHAWTTLPRPGSRELGRGWAASPSALYVPESGGPHVWHFDGIKWTVLDVGAKALYDTWASPAGDLFIGGEDGTIWRKP
ncbi:MAG: hypothetical protein ACTHM9_06845 [Gemmatimonadales bacterium]